MIPCFVAEKTLGKLAKWLRLLGFDTVYKSAQTGERLINTLEKDRILLTRTRKMRKQLANRKLIFIESDHLEQQLNQVFNELGLSAKQIRPFTRCLQCNVLIVSVAKTDLWGRVPDFIYETHEQFNRCPQCERIYWPGSHTHRSLEKISQLLDSKRSHRP